MLSEADRKVLTERARECARRVGQDATNVARIAALLGVSWHVLRGVWEYGERIPDEHRGQSDGR